MKTILICPAERRGVASLADSSPLVTVPFFGESVLNAWLETLAGRGVKEVRLLAADRPQLVSRAVQDGERWGLSLTVTPEMRGSTPEEARAEYRPSFEA